MELDIGKICVPGAPGSPGWPGGPTIYECKVYYIMLQNIQKIVKKFRMKRISSSFQRHYKYILKRIKKKTDKF